jgi:regulatory protein
VPGVVTGITPSPRKPGRFSLEVDGHEVALISIEAIERLKLGTGRALDERGAAEVEREAGILETYDRALNMLAARGRSSAELRRLLVKKGEPVEQVSVAIERLEHAGFLDDASFARQFTRSKATGAGLSRRRLQQELAKRGVARDVSTDAIEQVFAEEAIDEDASIERVARKKLRSLASADAPTKKRRLYSFLARRGYDSSDISRVLRDLLADGTDEVDEEMP